MPQFRCLDLNSSLRVCMLTAYLKPMVSSEREGHFKRGHWGSSQYSECSAFKKDPLWDPSFPHPHILSGSLSHIQQEMRVSPNLPIMMCCLSCTAPKQQVNDQWTLYYKLIPKAFTKVMESQLTQMAKMFSHTPFQNTRC